MVQTITKAGLRVHASSERRKEIPQSKIKIRSKSSVFTFVLFLFSSNARMREVCLYRVPVPDPLSAGVVELVGQPLVLQELVALGMQEQRLSASEIKANENKLDD